MNNHETLEIGNEAEMKWVPFLLGINPTCFRRNLTFKITETKEEKVQTPLNIEQALDAR